MMKHQIGILCALSIVLTLTAVAPAFEEFAVDSSGWIQERPDVDDGRIVWQEYVEFEGAWDWDVYGVDLLDEAAPVPIYVAAFSDNQKNPAIWNDKVVWQHDELDHWDIWLSDISNPNEASYYHLSPYENDQTHPAIHGNIVVWEHEYSENDGDIFGADITDPNNPSIYPIDEYTDFNQSNPAVYRNKVVYQDDSNGNWDILSADIWLHNDPQYTWIISDSTTGLDQNSVALWGDIIVFQAEATSGDSDIYARDMSQPASEPFLISGGAGLQQSPDISGHLVVWQDYRNDNWDIYGYNLITREEFQITTDSTHQINPAISGTLVVWEDMRDGISTIYAAWLDGNVIADCPNRLTGDVDGDCRVNLIDFALMAEAWLTCALDPISACAN